ncbi:MAG: DegT/DnrJ/EryC1/StrS family aminotransferase [bacterium]|nr:DegT/DnrJ/EryC1/StrS family aminotransferase [bacterium]
MATLAINGGTPTLEGIPPDGEPRGPKHRAPLETMFSEYCGAKYVIQFSSGTAALTAGLVALGVGPGDEVIVPSYTWPASVNCILHVNGIPVFADIDPKTFTIDLADVERKMSDRTKAIIPVDFAGHPACIPELMELAESRGLHVLEDACQASGAAIHGAKLGNIAHLTAFSFSGKPITSTQGGLLTTNSKDLFERAWTVGEHTAFLSQLEDRELRERYAPSLGYGFKFRLDPSAAEIAMESLAGLDERNADRIAKCERLTEALAGVPGITTPYVKPGYTHVYHMYTCLYDEAALGVPRSRFVEALGAEGMRIVTYVNSANYLRFPGGTKLDVGPIHLRPVFQAKDLYGKGCPFQCPLGVTPNYDPGTLPVSERLVHEEFNIEQHRLDAPIDMDTVDLYAEAIRKVVDNIDELR